MIKVVKDSPQVVHFILPKPPSAENQQQRRSLKHYIGMVWAAIASDEVESQDGGSGMGVRG